MAAPDTWACARSCLKKSAHQSSDWHCHRQAIYGKTCGCCAFCSSSLTYQKKGFTDPPKAGQWEIVPFKSLDHCPQHEELDTLENMFACCQDCYLAELNKYDLIPAIHDTNKRPQGFDPHPQVILYVADLLSDAQPIHALTHSEEVRLLQFQTSDESTLAEIPWRELAAQEDHNPRSGGYGLVHKYLWMPSRQQVALKTPLPGNEKSKRSLLRETTILAKYRHPNIVTLLGYTRKNDEVCLVLEWIPRTLAQQLPEDADTDLFKLALDVLLALQYLHSHGIEHRDVKPENILLTRRNGVLTAVLCDFGVSTSELRDGELMKTRVGTSSYLAPEIRSGAYTLSVDLYSWAKTFEEVVDHNREHAALDRLNDDDLEAFENILRRARLKVNAKITLDEAIRQVKELYLKNNPTVAFDDSAASLASSSASLLAVHVAPAKNDNGDQRLHFSAVLTNDTEEAVYEMERNVGMPQRGANRQTSGYNTNAASPIVADSLSPMRANIKTESTMHVAQYMLTPQPQTQPVIVEKKAAPTSPATFAPQATPSTPSHVKPAPTSYYSTSAFSAPTDQATSSQVSSASSFASTSTIDYARSYSDSPPASPYMKNQASMVSFKAFPSQEAPNTLVYGGKRYVYSDEPLATGDIVEYDPPGELSSLFFFKLNGNTCYLFEDAARTKKMWSPQKTSVRKVVPASAAPVSHPQPAPLAFPPAKSHAPASTPSKSNFHQPETYEHDDVGFEYVDCDEEPKRGDLVRYRGALYYFQPMGTACYLYEDKADVGNTSLRACSPAKTSVCKVKRGKRLSHL